jgi:PTH1 family peptidyl-tRNA hydrolase
MKLIVGLGNPGRRYENTRHNAGFRVIDELSERWRIAVNRRRFSGFFGSGAVGDEAVLLLKPTTYMNRSGWAVREATAFYKLALADLLVVVDDLALPLGRLRIRSKGSGGGHRGLTNVIDELGDDAFARLRIGIEEVESSRAVNHVLGPFLPQEQERIDQAILRAADAVDCWLVEGVEAAMNEFNRPDDQSDG